MNIDKAMYDMYWQFEYLKSDYAQDLIRQIRNDKKKPKDERKEEDND